MKTLSLLIALCLLPLGGWADEKKYPLEYVGGIVSDASNDDTMTCVLRNKKISCIKGQNQAKAEESKCPPIDCSLNSNRMCTTDENGCAIYVEDLTLTNVDVHATDKAVKEAKSQQWREKCEEYLKLMEEKQGSGSEGIYAVEATAYCTLYNSELLKELLEDMNK